VVQSNPLPERNVGEVKWVAMQCFVSEADEHGRSVWRGHFLLDLFAVECTFER
jgi:hypothetical protein